MKIEKTAVGLWGALFAVGKMNVYYTLVREGGQSAGCFGSAEAVAC